MLKKKIGKIATAGAITACMLANASVAMLPGLSMTAFAGEQLGENTFDDGNGLPWHICESGPGKLKFDISGGTYNIQIVNPGGKAEGGESRWDCQFRHRKLKVVVGHTYTVKAEVTSDQDGEIYTKIGDAGSPYSEMWHNGYGGAQAGQGWQCMPIKAGETLKIDSQFTATADTFNSGSNGEVCEWAWQFGGAGENQNKDCFPAGTNLKFDNLYFIDETSGDNDWPEKVKYVPKGIRVNQVGYYTNLAKKASLVVDKGAAAGQTFTLKNSSGTTVFTGKSTDFGYDADSDENIQILDFSECKTPGTYTLSCGDATSYEFEISDNLYDGILTDAVNYYYQNRSGINIESKYITSQGENSSKSALEHVAGHKPDTAAIQTKWVKTYAADGADVESSQSLDCTGGWYDAGDHGKYVVNGGVSVWTLQNMYERALSEDNNSDVKKFADGSGTVVIPEAGNKYPDILDEARVELEWMFKMIVPSSYKMSVYDVKDVNGKAIGSTTGKYENMVFHKMHDHKWTGLGVLPNDYAEEWGTKRIVKPPSTAATLNLAANAAQAARLWEEYDPTFAATCLKNAKACYAAAKANPELYAPLDQAIGGGAYGDSEVRDDFYWAACELYASTGDAAYLTDLSGYKDAFKLTNNLSGGENNGSFSSFNWGCTAGLGTLSLYLNQDGLSDTQVKSIKDTIVSTADSYIAEENKQGHGIPYHGAKFTDAINIGVDENGDLIEVDGYEWGSNSFVINNAIVMAYAYDIAKDNTYINGVTTALDYIFGRNGIDFSYVSGYGDHHLVNPHHRFWSHELDEKFPYAPSGVLSGGANSGMQDPYIRGAGYKMGEVAPQKCYIDSVESWSTNEVTINWNAPFAWVMSFMEDEAPLANGSNPGSSTTTTEKTDDAMYGDVNCDGAITISDLVLMARYVAEDSDMKPLSAQGIKNADCVYDSKVNSSDITALARYLAHIISASELGPQ